MTPKLVTTLQSYSRPLFMADVIAGVTVALVALPLSIAIAIASGAQPAAGVITAVVGGLLISLLGGSRVQIGGPTGAFIVVVYSVIERHGYDGLLIATAMAGVLLIAGALLRAGRLIALVPEAVIDGFTIGIAIIIAISQIKDLLGLSVAKLPADLLPKLTALWDARSAFNPSAAAIGLATIALIVLLRRLGPKVPGLAIAIALASLAVIVLALPVDTIVSRYGNLPSRLPVPGLPSIDAARLVALLPSAAIIAFLAAIESLLSAIVADRMIGGAHRSSAELMAQGVANIGCALFGGLPATGALARTATNVQAGGRTPVAGIVHALAILAVMAFAAPIAGTIAMPALAGLLILTAWRMSEPSRWHKRWRLPTSDRVALGVTLVLTVTVDLTVAIVAGTALSIALGRKA